MADEAELRDPVHPVFEASLVWRVVGHRRGEESGPFRWPVPPAAATAVGSASHPFAEQTVSPGAEKAAVGHTGRPGNSNQDLFFGASLALGSALQLLLGSATELVIAGCLFTTHPIPVEKWFIAVENKRR